MVKEDTFETWKLFSCVKDGKLLSIEEIHAALWQEVSPLLPPASLGK